MKSYFNVDVALVLLLGSDSAPGPLYDLVTLGVGPGAAANATVVVEDLSSDARFKDSPYVSGPPGLRFLAGVLLADPEERYGALCVLDFKPRSFGQAQFLMLPHFAELVIKELQRDKASRWQQEQQARLLQEQPLLLQEVESFSGGAALCDPSQPGWPVLCSSEAWRGAVSLGLQFQQDPLSIWRELEVALGGSSSAGSALGDGDSFGEGSYSSQISWPLGSAPLAPALLSSQEEASAAAAQQQAFRLRAVPRIRGPAARPLHLVFAPATGHGEVDGQPGAAANPAGTSQQQQAQQQGVPGSGYYLVVIQQERSVSSAASSAQQQPQQLLQQQPGSPSPIATTRLLHPLGSNSASSVSVNSPVGTPGHEAASMTESGTSLAPLLSSFQQMRPQVFEEVTLGPLVGQGSNGRCYRAVWQGAHVVVKIMEVVVDREQLLVGHQAVTSSSKGAVVEAVLGRALAHPHICQTFDYAVSTMENTEEGEAGSKVRQQVWIIQQYCNRGTLLEALERGDLKTSSGAPNLQAILRTAQEIAGAMVCLHQHDVLHGDLTCNNILLTSSNKDMRRWIPQVADFGLSRVLQSNAICTQSMGTVTHMPPELLQEGLLTADTDCYSFGVIMCELWAGERAWKGATATQVMHSVTTEHKELEPPEDAPADYQDLMRQCLQRDWLQRPSFDHILASLTAQLQSMKRASEGRRSLDSADGRGKLRQRQPAAQLLGAEGQGPAADAPAGEVGGV